MNWIAILLMVKISGSPMGDLKKDSENSPQSACPPLSITIIVDNYPGYPGMQTEWGFAAYVQYGDHEYLFDTGASSQVFSANLQTLGIDLKSCEGIMISHAHGDHIGGLPFVLGQIGGSKVYLLSAFPSALKQIVEDRADIIEVPSEGLCLTEGLHLTGLVPNLIPEQALVVETDRGLVIVTGCAHPGVVDIVRLVKERFDNDIHLLLGGFHLLNLGPEELQDTISELQELGVENVAPTHCTGDEAIAAFRAEYGFNFIQLGAGKVVTISPNGSSNDQ